MNERQVRWRKDLLDIQDRLDPAWVRFLRRDINPAFHMSEPDDNLLTSLWEEFVGFRRHEPSKEIPA